MKNINTFIILSLVILFSFSCKKEEKTVVTPVITKDLLSLWDSGGIFMDFRNGNNTNNTFTGTYGVNNAYMCSCTYRLTGTQTSGTYTEVSCSLTGGAGSCRPDMPGSGTYTNSGGVLVITRSAGGGGSSISFQ
jgi:hypothetical protein